MSNDINLVQDYLRYSNPHIQFRGNVISKGEVVYGGLVKHSKVTLCPVGITEEDINNNLEHLIAVTVSTKKGKNDVNLYLVDPKTVSLCTNMIDRSGEAVFTGDMVLYEGKEYVVKFKAGEFYLEGERRRSLNSTASYAVKVLKDRPVQEDCLDLDAIEIKSKVFEINGWARGGFSYNEETKRLDTLITDGFSDWNLPVSIMAMKIRDNIYGFGFGVVDEDGTRAYTGDIIKFTADVEVDDFICIRKDLRAVILMAHGGVHICYGGMLIPIQDVLQDNKLRSATIVSNIHEVEINKRAYNKTVQ